jgi:hypothetical protein
LAVGIIESYTEVEFELSDFVVHPFSWDYLGGMAIPYREYDGPAYKDW